jgi:fatty acid desaturase (delta-4 desaturase)
MPMLFHDDQTWMRVLVSPIFFFGLSAFWVFGVFALVNFMMPRKAVNVKSFMQVYNVVQIVVCSYMVWGLAPCLGFPNLFGINTAFDKTGEWFVFVHYLSKYLDWFDTFWIILNKKRSQLSFLHVYHHGTIVAVWGMLLHSGVGSGCTRYGAFINSLTHVIMYTHYLWTSFGLKNPFKAYITMWQITQFYSCLVHAFATLAFDRTPVHDYAWIQVLYQITMVYLFSNMMSWVPACVPDFSSNKEDKPISCYSFCHPDDNAKEEQVQKDSAWKQRYFVVRGNAYDVTKFNHPGGSQMLDLAVGRDATVMFESAHIRLELAEKTLASLPKFSVEELEKKGFDFGRKETWPTPSQSKLYERIRKRVVEEVLAPRGKSGSGTTARGVPTWHFLTVIGTWLLAATWFLTYPSIPAGLVLGWSLAWVGTGVQHTANHGGLTKNTMLGYVIGLLDDVAVGGSSIVWRYHHQVSHHAYCNDVVLDQDAHSSFPVMRMDSTQKWRPYHRFQWIYGPVAFCFLWISTQLQDLQMLLDAQSFLVKFKGTPSTEIVFAVLLKVIHFWWIVVLPYSVHGLSVMLYPWMACFGFGGFCLASMFIVSHNVDDAKIPNTGDWARQQIETSTSWGGEIGSFFSGGLNLQIEHHLFPCMAHHLYAPTQVIVKEECVKEGIRYTAYPTLLNNFIDHIKFLHHMGQQPDNNDKTNGTAGEQTSGKTTGASNGKTESKKKA